MSKNTSIGGLDESDHCYFKVYKILASEARRVLFNVLNWCCSRDLTKSFIVYANANLKYNKDKDFDETMLDQMEANPSGDKFDVSLLYTCLRLRLLNKKNNEKGRKELEKELFKKFKPIKTFRNQLIHNIEVEDSVEMNTLILKLQKMLEDALEKACEIYDKMEDLNSLVKHMKNNIIEIKQCKLDVTNVKKYKKEVQKLRKENENIVCTKGVKALKQCFKELSNVDPAAWLSKEKSLDVKMVFTRLDIITKSKESESCHTVSHNDMLMEFQKNSKRNIIVLEGEAGSGKSTLAKYILADWAEMDNESSIPKMKGLDEYNVVLYVECKKRSISKFIDLLEYLMPRTLDTMTERDLIRSVLSFRVLVVVDGLDEMNENSEKLIKEMLDDCVQRSKERIDFVLTTRPQKLKIVSSLCGTEWVHARIRGIPPERRGEFVEKLHDEMIKKGQSKQCTSDLVDYMKQSQSRMGEHYSLPLNLTLLTYLWANDPGVVHSLTSATSLYDNVLNHLKLRLIDRIRSNIGCASNENIESKVKYFMDDLFYVYFNTLKTGSMQISDKCQKKLQNKCKELDLPIDEMCSAFFVVDKTDDWDCDKEDQIYLSSPHKSIMEFFSSFHIFNLLTNSISENFMKEMEALKNKYGWKGVTVENVPMNDPNTVKEILRNLLCERNEDLNDIDLANYQNMLLHLAGLLSLKGKELLHQHGSDLIELLKEADLTEPQWLDLVAEIDCDSNITPLVAKEISKNLVIRDGHTAAALEIFKYLDINLPVQVIFENEVRYIPKMEELMESLSQRDCSVELLLKNHWKNPQNGCSTKHLEKLMNGECYVTRFVGNLDNLSLIMSSIDIENLRITIADDNQAKLICDDITNLATNLKLDLKYLGIHILKKVSPALLKPLPVIYPETKECGSVWLSDISDSDILWTCDVLSTLLPKDMKFNALRFPRCHLSATGITNLIENLHQQNIQLIKKGSIKLDSDIKPENQTTLKLLVHSKLRCEFHLGDEASVW